MHTEALSKRSLRDSAVSVELSDFFYLRLCEFGAPVAFPASSEVFSGSYQTKNPSPVNVVLAAGDPLKVVETVVCLDSVLVVALEAIRRWPNKGIQNKLVDPSVDLNPLPVGQGGFDVSGGFHASDECSYREASIGSQGADSSVIGNLVQTLETDYVTPLLAFDGVGQDGRSGNITPKGGLGDCSHRTGESFPVFAKRYPCAVVSIGTGLQYPAGEGVIRRSDSSDSPQAGNFVEPFVTNDRKPLFFGHDALPLPPEVGHLAATRWGRTRVFGSYPSRHKEPSMNKNRAVA